MGLATLRPHHMSVSKKITSKPATSPAPATKSAAKTAPKKKPAAAVPAPAPAPVAKPAPAPVPAPVKAVASAKPVAPAVKPVATKPLVTTLQARIDVGFGNALFVRGEGAGLSWDQGRAMECIEDNLWRVTLGESATGFSFKFLINDLTWSTGPDFTASSGASVTLTPEF